MQRKLCLKIHGFLLIAVLLFSGCFVATPACKDKGFATAYLIASKLTDPLCRAHQLYRQTLLVDTLYPTSSVFEKGMKKALLLAGSASNALFSIFTTLPGVELRFLTLSLQNQSFLHFIGEAEEKKWKGSSLSLLSWNVCCVSGGYSITDGGVLPWRYRISQLVKEIRTQDADILSLFEIFDIQTAWELYEELKTDYSHFYFNMGTHAIGLSSGLFIASKMEVADPEFVPFPKECFDGRGKHFKKGFFTFDLLGDNGSAARIYATHLQHSEQPENPSPSERRAREQEMELIVAHMNHFQNRTCVLTGDLNLDEQELEVAQWSQPFDQGVIEGCGYTWGGDAFCSTLLGKPVSKPLNLDHTLVSKSCGVALKTYYIESGFDGTLFNPMALSDHKGLLSIMTFCE